MRLTKNNEYICGPGDQDLLWNHDFSSDAYIYIGRINLTSAK